MTTINTNVGALQARTYAVSSGIRQQTSMERLSSGLRINSAADDAAGLAVANKMKSQLRGLEMAVRNSMDGVSLIQTAEAAMGEVTNMAIRMRELAVQMHNGVYTDADRNNAQLEVEALKSEIDKVCANTAFNDVKLLDGSFETYFRAGDTNQEIVDVKIDGVCLDQLGGEYVDRRSISVIDEIPPDEPTDTFLETVRFEKARTTIEASEASQITIVQSELGISELPLPQSGQYSLRGIDADEFTIDTATGNITSVGAMDYEAPTGGVAANSTEYKFDVVFTASDGTEYIDEVTFKLLDGGVEPSTSGSVEVTLTEASSVVINTQGNRIFSENFKGFIKANSASGTYELTGTDADKFSVDADGVLTAIGGLDFENPTGGVSGNSNTYEFTYKYTSSTGQVYSEDVTLNVLNDPSIVSISLPYDPVRVHLTVDNGIIALGSTDGLTAPLGFNSSNWTGASEMVFEGTQEDINAALASLSSYTIGATMTMRLTPTGWAYNPDNTHYYKYVEGPELSWADAKTAAENIIFNGQSAYLVTVTSLAEDEFLYSFVDIPNIYPFSAWMGANDLNVTNQWEWVVGPEAGTIFSTGFKAGITVTPGQYANWFGDQPNMGTGNQGVTLTLRDAFLPANPGWGYTHGFGDYDINALLDYIVEHPDVATMQSHTFVAPIEHIVTIDAQITSSTARRVTTEIIPTYGDSLISKASTEFNLTETPSFTMELSNFELLKNFSETFEGGTFNLSGFDVSNVSINQQTGELLLSSLDFENPNDNDSDNVYEFVINYEANGNIFIQNVKINILDVALPDMIPATTTVEATEAQSISINAPGTHELSTEFLEYVSQNQGGVFSLRGTDGSLSNFSINSATGEITASNLSFETPLDAGGDNSYEFIIEYCFNDERVQENILLTISDVATDVSGFVSSEETVNSSTLRIHPYFDPTPGGTSSFFTNVPTQTLDAGLMPTVDAIFAEFVRQNPGGTYAIQNFSGPGTLTEGVDFTLNPNTGEFVFNEDQLSGSDEATYTMEVIYTTQTGGFVQNLTFNSLKVGHSVDGVSNNTYLVATGNVVLDINVGGGDIVEDLRQSDLFSYFKAFSAIHDYMSIDGINSFPGTHVLSNLTYMGMPTNEGFSLSNNGILTVHGDEIQEGVYTFDLQIDSGIADIHTFAQNITVNVTNTEPQTGTKTVSSTSPTTPPELTKVGQQGLATRLDYQITEARGFKVHAPEDVGDREELKKFVDANPGGTFALSGADAAKFTVDSDGMIKSQSQIDHERQNYYEFELTYTAGGASYKESYFLTVVDDPVDNVKHLRDIGVGTRASSAEAVEVLNVAINQLTASRAKLGAIENRLTYNISNLTKASMLTDQASGRITDADFAKETSELAKNQILNQASMAMLSQANQSKQNILQLLG